MVKIEGFENYDEYQKAHTKLLKVFTNIDLPFTTHAPSVITQGVSITQGASDSHPKSLLMTPCGFMVPVSVGLSLGLSDTTIVSHIRMPPSRFLEMPASLVKEAVIRHNRTAIRSLVEGWVEKARSKSQFLSIQRDLKREGVEGFVLMEPAVMFPVYCTYMHGIENQNVYIFGAKYADMLEPLIKK